MSLDELGLFLTQLKMFCRTLHSLVPLLRPFARSTIPTIRTSRPAATSFSFFPGQQMVAKRPTHQNLRLQRVPGRYFLRGFLFRCILDLMEFSWSWGCFFLQNFDHQRDKRATRRSVSKAKALSGFVSQQFIFCLSVSICDNIIFSRVPFALAPFLCQRFLVH